MAAQDQRPFARNNQAKITNNRTHLICRLCEQHVKTIGHLVSACPVLTLKKYKDQQDNFEQCILWTICQYYSTRHAINGKSITLKQL